MQQSSAPPTLHLGLGLRKIVACSQPYLRCLLVSTVFATVSSLFFYTCVLSVHLVLQHEIENCEKLWLKTCTHTPHNIINVPRHMDHLLSTLMIVDTNDNIMSWVALCLLIAIQYVSNIVPPTPTLYETRPSL